MLINNSVETWLDVLNRSINVPLLEMREGVKLSPSDLQDAAIEFRQRTIERLETWGFEVETTYKQNKGVGVILQWGRIDEDEALDESIDQTTESITSMLRSWLAAERENLANSDS